MEGLIAEDITVFLDGFVVEGLGDGTTSIEKNGTGRYRYEIVLCT